MLYQVGAGVVGLASDGERGWGHMSTVVVTGAAGHVGGNLVRALLARGETVRALVHNDRRALEGLDVEIAEGDLLDPESLSRAFAGAEVVYHTAAHISISSDEWELLEAVNIHGVRNVLEACLRCGVRRLVHFSSIEALVDEPSHVPVDESRSLVESRDYPPYARSKATGDRLVRGALERGLDAVILYPTAIIGPEDYRLGYPNSGLLAICCGRLPALIDGGYDWVDVRDVVSGAIQAAARAPSGSQYILSGHWASLRDLAELAEELSGAGMPWFVCPMWLARVGAPFMTAWSRATGQRPLFTSEALRPLRGNRCFSHARATRDLDYHPRPLRETVADTWQWFQKMDLYDAPVVDR